MRVFDDIILYMSTISLEFSFKGDLFADNWPHPANDYGHVTYYFSNNKIHKDSGGYLIGYVSMLLSAVEKIDEEEKHFITSTDGDFGLRIVKSKDKFMVTIYSGNLDVYSEEMSKEDFIKFLLDAAKKFFDAVLKINPELMNNGNFLVQYTRWENLKTS